MADQDVDKLYEEHIDQGTPKRKGKRKPKKRGDGMERRQAPRVEARTTELTVRAELQVSAIDISTSGMAFFSSFPVQIGQQLQITIGTMFTVDAEVVNCTMEDQTNEFMDLQYKVQCRFPEEEQGKYLLVAIKEMERQRAKRAKAAEKSAD